MSFMKSKGEMNMNSSKNSHHQQAMDSVSTLSVKELMANQDDVDRRSDYSLDQSVSPPPAYSRGNGVTANTKLIMATVIVVSVIIGACIVAAAYAARQSNCQCPPTAGTSLPLKSSIDGEDVAIPGEVREANAAFAAFAERLAASPNAPSSLEVVGDVTTTAASVSDGQKQEDGNVAEQKPEAKTEIQEAKPEPAKTEVLAVVQEEAAGSEDSDKKKKNKKNKNRKNKKNKRKNRKNRKNKNRDDDDEDDDEDDESFGTMGPIIFHMDDLARTILEHEDKAMVNCVMEKRNSQPRSLLFPFLVDRNEQQTLKVFCKGGQDQPFGPLVAMSLTKESGPVAFMGNGPNGGRPPMVMYPGAPFHPNRLLANAMFPLPPPFLRDMAGKRSNRKLNMFPRILDFLPPFHPNTPSGVDRQPNVPGAQVRIISKKLPSDVEEAVLNVIEPLDLLLKEEPEHKGPLFAGALRRPMIHVQEPRIRIIQESVEEMPSPFNLEAAITAVPPSVPPHGEPTTLQQQQQAHPMPPQQIQPAEPQLISRRPLLSTPPQAPQARFPFNLLNGRRPGFLAGLFPPAPPSPRPDAEDQAPDQEQQEDRQQERGAPDNEEEEDEEGDNNQQQMLVHDGPRFMGPHFHFNRQPNILEAPGPRGVSFRERIMAMQENHRRQQQLQNDEDRQERPMRFNGPANNDEEEETEEPVQSEHEEHEVVYHQVRSRAGPPPGENDEEEEDEEFDPFVSSSVSGVMHPPPPPHPAMARQLQNMRNGRAMGHGQEQDWFEHAETRVHPSHFIQPRSLRRQQQEQGPMQNRPF